MLLRVGVAERIERFVTQRGSHRVPLDIVQLVKAPVITAGVIGGRESARDSEGRPVDHRDIQFRVGIVRAVVVIQAFNEPLAEFLAVGFGRVEIAVLGEDDIHRVKVIAHFYFLGADLFSDGRRHPSHNRHVDHAHGDVAESGHHIDAGNFRGDDRASHSHRSALQGGARLKIDVTSRGEFDISTRFEQSGLHNQNVSPGQLTPRDRAGMKFRFVPGAVHSGVDLDLRE